VIRSVEVQNTSHCWEELTVAIIVGAVADLDVAGEVGRIRVVAVTGRVHAGAVEVPWRGRRVVVITRERSATREGDQDTEEKRQDVRIDPLLSTPLPGVVGEVVDAGGRAEDLAER